MLELTTSPETQALHEALKAVPYGETVTFASLSEVIGRDVATVARSRLESARRIALREDGIYFEAIRQVGLRRIRAEEAPGIGTGKRAKIRRASRRALFAMNRVVRASNGVAPEITRQLTAEISALGLIAHLAEDGPTAAMQQDDAPMPPAKASRAFLEHIGAAGKTE